MKTNRRRRYRARRAVWIAYKRLRTINGHPDGAYLKTTKHWREPGEDLAFLAAVNDTFFEKLMTPIPSPERVRFATSGREYCRTQLRRGIA